MIMNIIAKRVLSKQNRYKAYHDNNPGDNVSNVKVVDYVRIKNPRHVGTGEVRYSKIMEVVKENGSCVTLIDGRKWNKSRIVKCRTNNVRSSIRLTMTVHVTISTTWTCTETINRLYP